MYSHVHYGDIHQYTDPHIPLDWWGVTWLVIIYRNSIRTNWTMLKMRINKYKYQLFLKGKDKIKESPNKPEVCLLNLFLIDPSDTRDSSNYSTCFTGTRKHFINFIALHLRLFSKTASSNFLLLTAFVTFAKKNF